MSRVLSVRLRLNDNKCYLVKRMLKLKLLICIRLGFDTAIRLSGRTSQYHKLEFEWSIQ